MISKYLVSPCKYLLTEVLCQENGYLLSSMCMNLSRSPVLLIVIINKSPSIKCKTNSICPCYLIRMILLSNSKNTWCKSAWHFVPIFLSLLTKEFDKLLQALC